MLQGVLLWGYGIVAAAGLVAGSFLNVVVYRYLSGESIVRPASHCPSCLVPLSAKDLVPLLSYLLLRGRCRHCRTGIPLRYPLMEAGTAGIFLLCFHHYTFTPAFLQFAVLFSLLLVISVIDLERHLIPNRLVLLLLGWVILWQLFFPRISTLSALGGFFTGGFLFLAIALLSKGGMGGGDVKLMAVLGLASGLPDVLLVFMLAFFSGALVGVLLIIFKQKTRKSPLPFGPFLSLAFLGTTFWGPCIWDGYFLV